MKIQNVKGGYDYLPKEQRIRNYINDTLRCLFESFGYNPIETPILCYYDILSDKYDEDNDILKEIYKLTDQGNRKLGLRYDLTVPFAKFITINKNQIRMPFKRYEIAKSFRDGPVKVGRDREFTQCDVDVVGIKGELIEAELMSLFDIGFKALDIPIIIKYNNRKLMTGLIKEEVSDDELIPLVTTILDKKEKVSNEELIGNLISLGLSKKSSLNLLSNLNLSLDELKQKYANTSNELIKEGLKEIDNLTNYLNDLNLLAILQFSPSLARGQNYYTGNVFEVYDKLGRISGSIGAGGRYDKMITNFIADGCEYPAVGISFGLSSIYEILKSSDSLFSNSLCQIYIIPLNTSIESLKLANTLRNMSYNVEIDMQERKLKKSIEYADKENIPYIIIYGEDEVKNKSFKIKNMQTKEEKEIFLAKIEEIKDVIVL